VHPAVGAEALAVVVALRVAMAVAVVVALRVAVAVAAAGLQVAVAVAAAGLQAAVAVAAGLRVDEAVAVAVAVAAGLRVAGHRERGRQVAGRSGQVSRLVRKVAAREARASAQLF
jgi:hypothetical protein